VAELRVPGVLLPHVRSDLMSSISRPQPPRNSCRYSVRLECPQDSTKRSRPGQCGSAGLCRITFWNSRYAAGARLMAVPGWPLPTFWTASIASTRWCPQPCRRSRSSRALLRPRGWFLLLSGGALSHQ
jgi:hypothetical protein